MSDTSTETAQQVSPADGRGRVWKGFAIGFLAAFVGLAIFLPMLFYNGVAAYQTRLWHYYILELQQRIQSSGTLGPTSDSGGAALTVFVQHLLISVVGGALGA